MGQPKAKTKSEQDHRELIALREIREAIRKVRHGTITVFVQDGLVIQIDRTEKLRLNYSREELRSDGDGI